MPVGRVVVVGSVNVDLVLAVDHVVAAGETLLATGSSRGAGGKGANQAVAAARAGADVVLVGAVGNDDDGAFLRRSLDVETIDLSLLRAVDAPTGLAVVSVAVDGENAIVVVSGANATVDALTAGDREVVAAADVVLLQLEIPLAAVAAAAESAHGTVVVNAAPARPLPAALLDRIDVLVVNQTEAAELAGVLDRVPVVIVTLGAGGAILRRRGEADVRVPAPAVDAVDTTGAGDTFCGVLAAGLARGGAWPAVLARAIAAAALAVQGRGAQPAMPTSAQIDAALLRP